MNREQTITGVICGTGACVPERVMDNDEIAQLVETSDQWIRERTGVARRHIAKKETTVSMAVEAGRQAMEEAGLYQCRSVSDSSCDRSRVPVTAGGLAGP